MPLIENVGLENLEPANRIEAILDGEDIAPATRLEYFLKKAAAGGGSGGLVVHVLYDEQEDALYLDKNYTEITTALLSGSSVVFIWEKLDTAPGYEEVHIYPFNGFGIDSDGYYVSLNAEIYHASSPTGILRQGAK